MCKVVTIGSILNESIVREFKHNIHLVFKLHIQHDVNNNYYVSLSLENCFF